MSRREERRAAGHPVSSQALPRECPVSLRPAPSAVQHKEISKTKEKGHWDVPNFEPCALKEDLVC